MITLFPETCAIAHACIGTQTSKFTCVIYCTCKIIVFSLFVFLLLDSFSKEKFFIEETFIECYVQETALSLLNTDILFYVRTFTNIVAVQSQPASPV